MVHTPYIYKEEIVCYVSVIKVTWVLKREHKLPARPVMSSYMTFIIHHWNSW